jgi:starch-binding outer membrane protein SusE/F
MRNYSIKSVFAGGLVLLGLAACTKVVTNNAYVGHGTAPVANSSATTLAPAVSDSLANAFVLTWTDAKYAAPFPGPALYTIQIDSAGKHFTAPAILTVAGGLWDSISNKTINTIVLEMGGAFNVPYTVELRVVSSYANNNDPLPSNTLTIQYTPYKTPPKVTPPPSGELFIVGSATGSGWANPVSAPTQQFTQIDSVTYKGTFLLQQGSAYDLLPVNGSWSNKYNVASAQGDFNTGGALQYVTGGGSDIPAPSKTGLYTIIVNFQTGLFTLSLVQPYDALWVPGDYQSWAPASAPMLGSPAQNGQYEGYVNITTTGGFKLTGEADWNGTSWGDTAKAGESGVLSTTGNNMNISTAGFYLLQVDTKANTWSATKINQWGLIGDFNGWSTDVVMTYDAANTCWTGTFTGASAGFFKIRANGAWTLSYGTGGLDGGLTSNSGGNIPFTAGTNTVQFFALNSSGYYTVSIH